MVDIDVNRNVRVMQRNDIKYDTTIVWTTSRFWEYGTKSNPVIMNAY